ncbi:MAG: hypothetical protein VB031_06420 [Eubacteriaceae bacterium]|nr:hypothetical protein [Eubacteriaceae bacterium]
MAKKKVRNKARDVLGDYYKSNRAVEKANEEARKEQGPKKGWSRSEKIMMTIIILGAIGIVIRYVILR